MPVNEAPRFRIFSGDISTSQGQTAIAREIEKYLTTYISPGPPVVRQSTTSYIHNDSEFVILTVTITWSPNANAR